MKKFYGTLFIVIVSLYSFGQYSISFNDTLRPFGTGAYALKNIIQDSNNYYVSGTFNSSVGQYPFILKLNDIGDIDLKRLYPDTIYGYALFPYNSMALHNNQLILCGQYKNTQGTFGFIKTVNKYSLDTIWTKVYAHPDTAIATQPSSGQFSELTAIKPTPGGGYILTGNYNKDCITGNLRSFLMKIDSVGNVEWRKTYDDIAYVFSLELAPNSGYSFINKFGGTSFILTDSLGNILLNKEANNYTGRATSGDLKYTGNNNFIVSTPFMYNSDFSHPLFGVNIFKINILTQQILWDKTYILYDNFDCISLHQAMGLETLPNGDIIVSGTAKNYGYDAVILKLNSNGDSLWCKSYDFDPDPWDCQLNDLIITEDGGFMGVGFFSDQNGPGWTAWMFKTDASGTIGFESSKFEGSGIKVFPNPAHDYTIIELPENLKNTAELNVYNSLGQLVFQQILNKGEKAIKLALGGFDTGVYFFEIMGEGRVLGSSRFVKD